MGILHNLEQMKARADVALLAYTKTSALYLQNILRRDAPWQDRTGRARQTLTGKGYKDNSDYVIELSYGVDYGVYLELAHEKRFAIIHPTIQHHSAEVIQAFEGLLNDLKLNIRL